MSVKWSAALFLAAATLLAQGQEAGKSADQLRDFANSAKASNDLQTEVNYLCQAADLDQKKYRKKCDQAKDNLSKMFAQFQADLAMGRTELQRKDYPGALRDLQKITFGPNRAEAQELIRQAQIGIHGGTPVDPSSLAAFNTARAAYFHGDFDMAEAQAKLVHAPAIQSATNQLLTNISIYRDNMKQADAMFRVGDLKGAEQKYQFAAVIQQNGPGNPVERLREVKAAEARIEAAKAQQQSAMQSKLTQQPAKANHVVKARNSLDAAHHNEMSNTAQSVSVTGKQQPGQAQEDSKAMDDNLKEGIVDFYASHFLRANDAFSAYLQGEEKQYAGAAHFYLGASLLMQALLTSAQNQPQVDMLRQQARAQFMLAKQLHYIPIESALSPKVFTQWMQIGN